MGALLGIPVALAAVGMTIVFVLAVASVVGFSVAQLIRSILRSVPIIGAFIPDEPPSEEEIAKAKALEEKRAAAVKAQIDAEIAAAAREARRPQTSEEAVEQLATSAEAVKTCEAKVSTLQEEAKSKAGGWNAVATAREELRQAEERDAEVVEDAEKFGVRRGSGGGAGIVGNKAATTDSAPMGHTVGQRPSSECTFSKSHSGLPPAAMLRTSTGGFGHGPSMPPPLASTLLHRKVSLPTRPAALNRIPCPSNAGSAGRAVALKALHALRRI
eukprot:TRINITY_DN67936_c0_g1_i1.p1 TRINITY_DN67936_c0_g1~~TRINITY_DN67936_c0_g1_i1.p1  ORF type:complete len:281 (-),score=54.68 TRINITY_DN67936_c0_g1_i1:133-948(-)